jgi:hypothetical protein
VEGGNPRLRLGIGDHGDELLPTEAERIAIERHAREQERLAKEQERHAREQERIAKEQECHAREQERIAKEQALAANERALAASEQALARAEAAEAELARLRAILRGGG